MVGVLRRAVRVGGGGIDNRRHDEKQQADSKECGSVQSEQRKVLSMVWVGVRSGQVVNRALLSDS